MNESAFPHSHIVHSNGIPSYEDSHCEDGMTLRDYFAAKALQGLCANTEAWEDMRLIELAAQSFGYADAMLEARKQ